MVDLGLGGSTSWATAVSNTGIVVGYSTLPGETAYHAFAWSRATGMVDLETLGGSGSYAWAVNDDGVVVGYSYLAGNTDFHAFRWTAREGMVDLGTLGGWSIATAINGHGTIVGSSSIPGGTGAPQHGFVWSQTHRMVDLGALTSESHAVAVSDNDVIVGYNVRPSGMWQAFAWSPGVGMQNIEPAGGEYSVAQAISPNGAFVVGVAGTDAALWTRPIHPQHRRHEHGIPRGIFDK
jgi:probable HAF family extracellular repeat protein